jgi:hypothetical protein
VVPGLSAQMAFPFRGEPTVTRLPGISEQDPVKQDKQALRNVVLAATVHVYINRRVFKGKVPNYLRSYPSGRGKYMLINLAGNLNTILRFLSSTKGVYSTNLSGLHPGKFYRLLLSGKMPKDSLFTRVKGEAFAEHCYQYDGGREVDDNRLSSEYSDTGSSDDLSD